MHDPSVALSNGQYTGLVSRRMPLSASVKSAFSNYVRSGCRGEPDGRTAVMNDSRGRESDAAFTPSPVDPIHRTSKLILFIFFSFLFYAIIQIDSISLCMLSSEVDRQKKKEI